MAAGLLAGFCSWARLNHIPIMTIDSFAFSVVYGLISHHTMTVDHCSGTMPGTGFCREKSGLVPVLGER